MRIYFAGHNSFGNRGCEALVRSITGLVREQIPAASFMVPSLDIDLDKNQWPDHHSSGVGLVQAEGFPKTLKLWHWSRRLLPAVEKLGRPTHWPTRDCSEQMRSSDVVIMTGGDTISLDYDLPSLYSHSGYIDHAKRLNKKAVLWAASVGPFSKKPHVERLMKSHLVAYDQISVRESSTALYLQQLGLTNVVQVTDPAFTLKPEPFEADEWLPSAPNGVLGLNVSPLIRKFRSNEQSMELLDQELAVFIQNITKRTGYGLVLLPHVGPLDGGARNNDHFYMQSLIDKYRLSDQRLKLASPSLNAAQLKYLISKFRFFIGARTHATIAAFSMSVPTISIAYSVKAKGINRDLFGDLPVVLDTPLVSEATLSQSLRFLEQEESFLRAILEEKMPEWRRRATIPAHNLVKLLPR